MKFVFIFSVLFSANALRRLRIDHSLDHPYAKAPAVWTNLIGNQPSESKLPRYIWSNWEQGDWKTTAPKFNKICLEQWSTMNPGWEHKVLSGENVSALFPELQKLFQERPHSITHRSDMLRLWLLAEYGGVWADASLLPVKPLDSFVQKSVAPSGFFTFQYKDAGHVTTWFLAALPKNSLVEQWKQAFIQRWRSNKKFGYYEVHDTLKVLVQQNDANVMPVWDKMPVIGQNWPHSCTKKGCPDYWKVMDKSDVPPMLKRPSQNGAIPEEWWQGYKEFVAKQ